MSIHLMYRFIKNIDCDFMLQERANWNKPLSINKLNKQKYDYRNRNNNQMGHW